MNKKLIVWQSWLHPYYSSIIAFAAAIIAAIFFIVLQASNPLDALTSFFAGPWSSPWLFGNMLDQSALFITAGLGIVLSFRGGTFNLGGEGQIYLGGLAASAVLLSMKNLPGPIALMLACLTAITVGALLGTLSGWLKMKGASELITSFLLSAAIIPLVDYCIIGPLRDTSGSLQATKSFAADRILAFLLPPSRLSISFLVALLLVLLGHFWLNSTRTGYRFRIAGSAPVFARYGGINVERYWIPSMLASGALQGLAGFFAVAGTYGICHRGFSGGLGWNAITVALVAGNKPLALIPAAILYAWIRAGSDAALLSSGIQLDTAAFIQAFILILVTVQFNRRSK
ncbi:MAG: ABC transporter permease [Treponema sp.]|jgi:simple sugar transport system permease protein|nr:ABC transporter permease [Treponema sp.]